MEDLILALGTNIGDRERNLQTAIQKLNGIFGTPLAQSGVVATESCGFNGPEFLNTVLKYRSSQDPYEVLALCKAVEREMGRVDRPEYDQRGNRIFHDRIIDIDILEYGNLQLDTAELTLPHPQIKTRPYILPLLLEIDGK